MPILDLNLNLMHQKMVPPTLTISLLIILIIFHFSTACQLGNKQMIACYHRYLERDFTIVENLLKRPPYGENGHILLEETELDSMCERFGELKSCYETMFGGCVSYVSYAHMKRILTILRSIHEFLCGAKSFHIKDLIQGGYCLEIVRKESICSQENPRLHPNTTLPFNLSTLLSTPATHQWPYTLNAMMRFEVGVSICPYLREFTACLTPEIERRCRDDSRIVWKSAIKAILDGWC